MMQDFYNIVKMSGTVGGYRGMAMAVGRVHGLDGTPGLEGRKKGREGSEDGGGGWLADAQVVSKSRGLRSAGGLGTRELAAERESVGRGELLKRL